MLPRNPPFLADCVVVDLFFDGTVAVESRFPYTPLVIPLVCPLVAPLMMPLVFPLVSLLVVAFVDADGPRTNGELVISRNLSSEIDPISLMLPFLSLPSYLEDASLVNEGILTVIVHTTKDDVNELSGQD